MRVVLKIHSTVAQEGVGQRDPRDVPRREYRQCALSPVNPEPGLATMLPILSKLEIVTDKIHYHPLSPSREGGPDGVGLWRV